MKMAFRSMFRKNLLIVAGMTLLMLFLCGFVIRMENTRIHNALAREMSNGLEMLETQLASVQGAFYKISEQENIASLSLLSSLTEPADYYETKKAQEYIASLAFSNGQVLDMILFLRNPGIVLTKNSSFYPLSNFRTHYHFDIPENDMLSFVKKTASVTPGFFSCIFQSSFEPGRNRNAIIYYFSASSALGSNQLLTFIILEEKQVIRTIFPSGLPVGSRLRLTSNGTALIDTLEASDPLTQCLSAQSHLFSVQLRLSSAYINDTTKSLRTFTWLFFISSLALGLALSIVAAYRQARPVRLLLMKEEEKNKHNSEEMAFVREEILRMNQRHQDIMKQLNNTRRALTHNMLERLLYSRDLDADDMQDISEQLPAFPERYCVCYGQVSSETDTSRAAFMHAIQTRRPAHTLFHQLDSEGFVLIWEVQKDKKQADICQAAYLLISTISFGENPSVHLSVSLPASGIEHLAQTFDQARKAFFAAREMKEKPLIISSGEIEQNTLTLQDFSALYRSLISGSYEKSAAMIDHAYRSASMDAESLYYVMRTTLDMAARDGLKHHRVEAPQHAKKISQQLEILKRKSLEITEMINGEKKSHNSTLKQDILQYIHDHYDECELYGRLIAEKFCISEKYLYNFLKEQTGSSLGEILMALRLGKACQLLAESALPVGEIGTKTGFANQNTFYKAFKRQYGVSPTEYRQREYTVKG